MRKLFRSKVIGGWWGAGYQRAEEEEVVASFRPGTSTYACMDGRGDHKAWRDSQYRSLNSKRVTTWTNLLGVCLDFAMKTEMLFL